MRTAILAVDDDKMVLDSIRIQLQRYYASQHLLEFAQDATEGLEVIADLASDGITTLLVISDWIMPGMNGDEFLRKVRTDFPDIKTMMLTGQPNGNELDAKACEQFSNAILYKPWSEQQLIATIDQLLKQKA